MWSTRKIHSLTEGLENGDTILWLRWFGAQGRLEIHVEGNKFYAHIPVNVGRITAKKSGKPMKNSLVIHGLRDKIQVEKPKGEKVASIDLGINMLATVVVNDGTVLFIWVPLLRVIISIFRRGLLNSIS